MVSLSLKNVVKRFGDVAAVDGVDIQIDKGELFFLLGPSGCGKSTLLRSIAGFCEPNSGQILFGDRDVTRVPPHKRNTGMVFQNYALWPHMTVAENVAYGLDVRKIVGDEKARRVREALEMVQMEKLGERNPNQLSGGQQQRVALARALVIEPDVILLDEPLSNLDAKLRLEMRDEITRIHSETGITTIYVTHDQKEALSMATRMAVMELGKVMQVGTPQEVYKRPVSTFVAQFIGETNLIKGSVGSQDGGRVTVNTEVGELIAEARPDVGEKVVCSIRPEALQIRKDAASQENCIKSVVKSHTYLGEMQQFVFERDGLTLRSVELNPPEPPEIGSTVTLTVDPEDIVILPNPDL